MTRKSPVPRNIRGMATPKTLFQVLDSVAQKDSKQISIQTSGGSQMLKAKCKRLAERNILVGRTNFSFDKDGLCEIVSIGDVILDFASLVAMNGVEDLTNIEVVKVIPPPASKIEYIPDNNVDETSAVDEEVAALFDDLPIPTMEEPEEEEKKGFFGTKTSKKSRKKKKDE